MDNIKEIGKPQASEDMLSAAEDLETLAREIRSGLIASVAIAYVENGPSSYVSSFWRADRNVVTLLGGLHLLQVNMADALKSKSDP